MAKAGDETRPVGSFLSSLRGFVGVALLLTVILNLIALVSPIYMMQVYDRILSSGSYDSLILLTAVALFLIGLFIAAEGGRRRVMGQAGRHLGASLDTATLKSGFANAHMLPTELSERAGDLNRVQSLLVNGIIAPVLDIPFVPFFLLVLFLVHPLLGAIGLVGAIILVGIAIATEKTSRETTEEAAKKERIVQSQFDHTIRQRGAIVSMGMAEYAVRAWRHARLGALDDSLTPQARVNFFVATARAVRQMLQVIILGAGAYLALNQQVSAGAIIAGSILMGRALAPIDQTVGSWKHLIKGRQSWSDLKDYLNDNPDGFSEWREETPLPRPQSVLKFQNATVGIPGVEGNLLQPLDAQIPAGKISVLVGASGAGKTSLLQTVAGAWPLQDGSILLGGRDMASWAEWDRGRYVGYLPQHVELMTGTVFQNIARFTQANNSEVFTAAQAAGAHDMILGLPAAYDTPIGLNGVHLSAGQRQSIGLARALFRDPALVVLDEPTAHLDKQRTAAFIARMAAYAKRPDKERETNFLIATHNPAMLTIADVIMTIVDRRILMMSGAEYAAKIHDIKERQALAEANDGANRVTS